MVVGLTVAAVGLAGRGLVWPLSMVITLRRLRVTHPGLFDGAVALAGIEAILEEEG